MVVFNEHTSVRPIVARGTSATTAGRPSRVLGDRRSHAGRCESLTAANHKVAVTAVRRMTVDRGVAADSACFV
jgi:hypothetical protein